jgi:DNA-directed RNA polymerase specialized sigma24 family protein
LGRAGFTDDVVRQVLGLSQAEAAVILGQSVRTLDNL